jgi:transcription initiation factor TFIIIB Brf1 subunit/transcription initiation factor TFIIB
MGTNIEGNNKTVLKRLQGWGAVPYRETSLKRVFNIIHDKCAKLRLFKCIEDDANIIYKKLNDMKHSDGRYKDKYIINRGTNRMGIIASCIFFACKRKNITRSPREIASVFGIRTSEVTKGCKNFRKKIYEKNINLETGDSNPEHFITRFCEELRFSEENKNYAIKVGKNICKLSKSSNHTPLTIAICSIYVTTINKNIYNIDRKLLSRYFNVSEITIIKTFTSLEKYINILDNTIEVEYLIEKNNFDNYCSDLPEFIRNKTNQLQVGVSSYTKKDFERKHNFLNNQLLMIDNYLEKLNNYVISIKDIEF